MARERKSEQPVDPNKQQNLNKALQMLAMDYVVAQRDENGNAWLYLNANQDLEKLPEVEPNWDDSLGVLWITPGPPCKMKLPDKFLRISHNITLMSALPDDSQGEITPKHQRIAASAAEVVRARLEQDFREAVTRFLSLPQTHNVIVILLGNPSVGVSDPSDDQRATLFYARADVIYALIRQVSK